MHFLLAFILLVHGVLHLAGFSKAFGFGDAQLHSPISKTAGIFWLLTSLLFVIGVTFILLDKDYWWEPIVAALLLSQIMIFTSWHEAKYGSIANIILLILVVPLVSSIRFENRFKKDVDTQFEKSYLNKDSLLTEASIENLPLPVKKYIRFTGAINQPVVRNFKVKFSGQIRKDEKSEWMPFTSEQYNFLDPSSRLFFMKATMKHLPVVGYHAYGNGNAFMDIRLLSLIKVQYQSGEEMSIAETVTFFNDMVCLAPATLIDKRIKWDSVAGNKVHASFTTHHITISAWLYFNEQGQLINFISEDRFAMQEDGSMKKIRWSTPVKSYKKINVHQLVASADAVYACASGDFCYGQFLITNIEYNLNPPK
jgi:hypothetical protein